MHIRSQCGASYVFEHFFTSKANIVSFILYDWYGVIENIDGDVIDIALHTVKIQNWDKTITTIPTYALIGESFKNWRGMQESGGRRIKRTINIDISTILYWCEILWLVK